MHGASEAVEALRLPADLADHVAGEVGERSHVGHEGGDARRQQVEQCRGGLAVGGGPSEIDAQVGDGGQVDEVGERLPAEEADPIPQAQCIGVTPNEAAVGVLTDEDEHGGGVRLRHLQEGVERLGAHLVRVDQAEAGDHQRVGGDLEPRADRGPLRR